MSKSGGIAYCSGSSDGHGSHSSYRDASSVIPDTASSTTPLKSAVSFSSGGRTVHNVSIQSRCEAVAAGGGGGGGGTHGNHRRERRLDPIDLELGEIDGDPEGKDHGKKPRVHVESAFEQHEERV